MQYGVTKEKPKLHIYRNWGIHEKEKGKNLSEALFIEREPSLHKYLKKFVFLKDIQKY